MRTRFLFLCSWLVSLPLFSCSPDVEENAPSVRFLSLAEAGPHGSAPGAQHRLLATNADGSKEYALILARGDEVAAALSDFAKSESVVAAHFTAIGGVRDPEIAWFDLEQKKYKAMLFHDQMEVVSLVGDVGVGADGKTAVHAHLVIADKKGAAFGGHLIGATTSPTLEVFVTTFTIPLQKKLNSELGIQTFDLTAPEGK